LLINRLSANMSKEKTERVSQTIRIKPKLRTTIKTIAVQQDRIFSDVVEDALEAYCINQLIKS